MQKQNHYSAFQYQDIHVNKFLFPQVTCVPLAQAESAQLITPTPNISSVVRVKEIPKVNTSKWRDYGCTVSGTGAAFIKKI